MRTVTLSCDHYPVRPQLYGGVQGVSGTLRGPLRLGLPVAKHLVILHHLAGLQCAGHQADVGLHGPHARVVRGEVPQEADAVALSVEAQCVSSLHIPAPALVYLAVTADQKTGSFS